MIIWHCRSQLKSIDSSGNWTRTFGMLVRRSICWAPEIFSRPNNAMHFEVDFDFVQNVAGATSALLKLNGLSAWFFIWKLLRQKEKVTRATFCTKWKSTFTVANTVEASTFYYYFSTRFMYVCGKMVEGSELVQDFESSIVDGWPLLIKKYKNYAREMAVIQRIKMKKKPDGEPRCKFDISVLVAQWLERLTGHQKVAGSISVWGSEIVFLSIGLDDNLSIILRYFQALVYSIYKLHEKRLKISVF